MLKRGTFFLPQLLSLNTTKTAQLRCIHMRDMRFCNLIHSLINFKTMYYVNLDGSTPESKFGIENKHVTEKYSLLCYKHCFYKKKYCLSSIYEFTFGKLGFHTALGPFVSRLNSKYINIDELPPSLKFCLFKCLINYANIF